MSNRVLLALLSVCVVGCARSLPPPGGPPDTTPPFVVETLPEARAASVSTDSELRLIFNESVRCGTVGRSITLQPETRFGDTKCSGNRFQAEFADSLLKEQTYVVTVRPGIEDKHGVRSRESYVFAFSTGDSLDLASIQGKVIQDTAMVGGAVIWATFAPSEPDSLGTIRGWDYMTTSNEDGSFVLEYLRPGGYYVLAFIDGNSNGRYETESELGVIMDVTFEIRSRRQSVENVVLTIPLPEEEDVPQE